MAWQKFRSRFRCETQSLSEEGGLSEQPTRQRDLLNNESKVPQRHSQSERKIDRGRVETEKWMESERQRESDRGTESEGKVLRKGLFEDDLGAAVRREAGKGHRESMILLRDGSREKPTAGSSTSTNLLSSTNTTQGRGGCDCWLHLRQRNKTLKTNRGRVSEALSARGIRINE